MNIYKNHNNMNKEDLKTFENRIYEDYDSIIIQLNKGENVKGNIKMMRQDLDAMMNLHGQTRQDILELLIQTLESESTENKKDA